MQYLPSGGHNCIEVKGLYGDIPCTHAHVGIAWVYTQIPVCMPLCILEYVLLVSLFGDMNS